MRLRALTLLMTAALGSPAFAGDAEALVRAGFPALSRPWRSADYTKALGLIESGKVELPLLSNARGAALLGRLTSPENLDFDRNRKLPLTARMQDFVGVTTAMGKLMLLYVQRTLAGDQPHAELARVTAFLHATAALGVELSVESEAAIAGDPPDSQRRKGLQQMRRGVTSIFGGSEQMLSESAYGFTSADYALLLRAMDESLPTLRTVFAPDVALELGRKLEADEARFTGPNRARLVHMVELLTAER